MNDLLKNNKFIFSFIYYYKTSSTYVLIESQLFISAIKILESESLKPTAVQWLFKKINAIFSTLKKFKVHLVKTD